jgi:hypothetical protein
LLFVCIDQQKREVLFDATGMPLSFHQLSGGEREIAFLIGQIDRFSLKRGLLLVDEPELHLNYDLLRSWIGFLRDSVEEGQIWLATHSLEVVEVAGQEATFLFERDEATRRVRALEPLRNQPIVATLSRAVGSPAFSISTLAFVVIEGEEEIGERERFRMLCEVPVSVRFLEGGSCKEVIRRIEGLRALAAASGHQIRIGGVVDGDWRAKQEQQELAQQGVFVLPVHEVENYFLHPATLRELMSTLGRDPADVDGLVLMASDKRAGTWIFDAARTNQRCRDFPEPSKAVRDLVHRSEWDAFADAESKCAEIARAHGALTQEQIVAFSRLLGVQARVYEGKRNSPDLWQVCEGKEVFRAIVRELGLADADAAERAVLAIWGRKPELVPDQLGSLRDYINGL